MINLRIYRSYCVRLQEICGASTMLMAVQEEHLKKKLRDSEGYILVGVYPSHHVSGSEDNVRDVNTCLIYLLKAFPKSGCDEENELQEYARLQEMTAQIREQLIFDADKGIAGMRELDRESIAIEPEYNIAGGYIGYSITFSF